MKNDNFLKFLNSDEDGVYYVGHASILVRIDSKFILYDPAGCSADSFFYSWFYYPEQYLLDEMIEVLDYVIVSHCHKDHLDSKFLKKLKSNTEILVYDIESLKRDLDIANLNYRTIPDSHFQLTDNISIKGFINTSNNVDSSSLIYTKNFCVYHGNDNWASVDDILVACEGMKINVACVPFAFVHWYPYLFTNMSEAEIKKESDRMVNLHFEYAVNFLKKVNLDYMIPFGSNLSHDSDALDISNTAVKNPFEFKDYVRKNYPDLSVLVLPIYSDDFIIKKDNKYRIQKKERNKLAFRNEINDYLTSEKHQEKKRNYFNKFEILSNDKFKKVIENRINKSIPKLNSEILIVSKAKNTVLKIDFLRQTMSVLDQFDEKSYSSDKLTHIFQLDEIGTKLYFSGKVYFEDILGARRFKVFRNSNYHCKETFSFFSNL
jgi:L-ascorbate metabolism protein UlaG (beta-lactamase superfamily)